MEILNLIQGILYKNQKLILLLVTMIMLEVCLGTLRAGKEKRINSCIGIDGVIRKTSELVVITFASFFDYLLNVNFIGWLPESIKTSISQIGISFVGVTGIFCLYFIVYEGLSTLKNISLLGLPLPKGLEGKVAAILEDYTDEMPTTNKNGDNQ